MFPAARVPSGREDLPHRMFSCAIWVSLWDDCEPGTISPWHCWSREDVKGQFATALSKGLPRRAAYVTARIEDWMRSSRATSTSYLPPLIMTELRCYTRLNTYEGVGTYSKNHVRSLRTQCCVLFSVDALRCNVLSLYLGLVGAELPLLFYSQAFILERPRSSESDAD